MTRSFFALGLSGHDACASCCGLLDLLHAGDQLAPGDYWIQEVTQTSAYGFQWYLAYEPLDWGTLEVRPRGDWCLRSLAGLQAGPGYLVV